VARKTHRPEPEPGCLYVVGTPIGNLNDLSQRAGALLGAVDRVAAEDTRRTRALLAHLGLRRKGIVRLDAHATERGIAAVLDELERGRSVALVSDAGMPSVSDPGARVVQAAVARDLGVVVVPGPSAVSAAIALSGLVEGPFLFLGFLPRRSAPRNPDGALHRVQVARGDHHRVGSDIPFRALAKQQRNRVAGSANPAAPAGRRLSQDRGSRAGARRRDPPA